MRRGIFDRKRRVVNIAHLHDDDSGAVTIEMLEDCDPLIRQARDISDASDGKADGMRLEALIPDHVLRRSYLEGWFHDEEAWRRWANDPANRPFRIEYNGRVNTL